MTASEAAMYDPDAFELYRTSPSRAACPMGERLSDAQRRMVGALELIGHRHSGETVVAVTHAVMIRLVVARLTGVEGESWRIPVGRGSLTRFHVADGRISLAGLPEGSDVD
jgi:broad specificity phosphatase PhoE